MERLFEKRLWWHLSLTGHHAHNYPQNCLRKSPAAPLVGAPFDCKTLSAAVPHASTAFLRLSFPHLPPSLWLLPCGCQHSHRETEDLRRWWSQTERRKKGGSVERCPFEYMVDMQTCDVKRREGRAVKLQTAQPHPDPDPGWHFD